MMTSNNSISKQLLINHMGLNEDLAEIIKGFAFYDQVGQLSKDNKSRLMFEMKNHITIGISFGFTDMIAPLNFVQRPFRRWAYVRVWKLHSALARPMLQYIMCSVCGNFYQTTRQLPLTRDEIQALPTDTTNIQCTCVFKFNMQQQYASIQLNSNLTADSEFDDDFEDLNDSASEHEAVGHLQLNNTDDSDNSDQDQEDEEQEVEYFYNHM